MYLNIITSHNLLLIAKSAVRSCNKRIFGGKTFTRQLSLCQCSSPLTSPSLSGRSSFQGILWDYGKDNDRPNFVYNIKAFGLLQKRFYRSRGSQQNEPSQDSSQSSYLHLMDFPWIIWPSLWYTFRNWIFANLIIKPYLDKEFTLSSFKNGSIQAVVHVSQELSKGNFNALEGFLTKPSIEEAQRNYALLSLKQRLDLAVEAEDIFFCFPYQIGMIFTKEGDVTERTFVEITMCYHIFKGLQDHIESLTKSESSHTLQGVYDNHDRISIANYRFIREFTKGVEDDWTVNIANHFKPGEHNKKHRY
ncbi:m-AAA protease-interacting protein 1, mitochondrial [Palaemon carinicauda]|uniref:m-AAA protease-interacting protein 1, mitochondrial n=1 Tax=Palaemon carinicauda TaxID=392227 RepID=UPI0035B59141